MRISGWALAGLFGTGLPCGRAAEAPAADEPAAAIAPEAPAPPAENALAASPPELPVAAAVEATTLSEDSPERRTQETVRAFLQESDAKRLDAILRDRPPRSDLAGRLRTLEEAGRTEELTDLYLKYLLAYPPDKLEFLDVLARVTWVLNQRNDESGLLTLLFQQADRFPPNAPQVAQIKLIEAEYLLRVGLAQPALVLLHKLGDNPAVDFDIRMLANGRAGFLHERMGQPDEAITAYLKTQGSVANSPQAGEATLRAALLLLEAGRTDEALAALEKLRGASPAVIRQSGVGAVMADLGALSANPDLARSYWKHSQQWYPLWLALAPKLGVPAEDPRRAAPTLIEDYRRLAFEGTVALNQQDRARYFQMVNTLFRSAQWRPSDLADAANLLYQGSKLAPECLPEILALEAAIEKDLPPVNPLVNEQLAQLRISALLDTNKPDEAREAAAEALRKYGGSLTAGPALARLYGLAVLRSNAYPQDGAEAVRRLTESLTEPTAHGQQRVLAVAVLTDLLLALQREGEAQAVLERELALPAQAETGGARFQDALRATLLQLQQRQVQLRQLAAGLEAWWKQYQLPWFDYATAPAQRAALGDKAGPAAVVARSFANALDPKASLAVRANALNEAWSPYPMLPLTGGAVADAARDFSTREDFPAELRYIAWAKSMWHLCWTGQRAAVEKLLAAAPPGAAPDLPAFTRWLEYLNTPINPPAQQAFAEKLLAQEQLDRVSLILVVRALEALVRGGAPAAAETLQQKLAVAKLDPSAVEQFRDLHQQISPLIAQYRATAPAFDALRELVLAQYPEETAAARLPEHWRELNPPLQPDLDLLTLDEAREGLFAVLRDRLPYGQHPLQVFRDLGDALPHDAAGNALRFHMFEAVQRLTRRDDDRFYATLFAGMVDFDDPDLAARGWTVLAPTRSPEFPKSSSFINYYQAVMNWRAGQAVDLAAALGPLESPSLEPYKLRLAFDYYLQRQDRAALQNLLRQQPEEALLDPVMLGAYLQALRFLGKEAALTRASAAARELMAVAVVESWARPEQEEAARVFELARSLNDPAAYPRAWVDFLLQSLRNENARDLVRLADAQLQHNWAATLAAADSFLSRNPTFYDFYWPKARALVELGRAREALEPLRLFVKYSANEPEHPEAVELLRKLEAGANPPPRPAAAAR